MADLRKINRFVLSGLLATAINFGLLYLFTDFFKVWYIVSAIVAFIASVFTSFIFQKYWTFKDMSKERIHYQAIVFFVIAAINLALNTFFLYLLVEYAGLYYLVAQVLTSIIIAAENFFVYRHLIFKKS